jgi:phage virion morphogenesis protein
MAGAGILKAAYDDSEVQRIIDALHKASSPIMLEIANAAGAELDRISRKEGFEKEKDPVTGTPWRELSKPRDDGSTNPILRAGGQLHRSLNWNAFPDGSVIFGSNMEYARIHQKGGEAGRGKKTKIPARPYMGVPKDFDRNFLNDPAVLDKLGIGGART